MTAGDVQQAARRIVDLLEHPIGNWISLSMAESGSIGANSPVIFAAVAVISSAKALAYPSLQRTSHVTSPTNRLSIIAPTGPLLAVTSFPERQISRGFDHQSGEPL